jgi:hypothetical protein
MTNSSKLMATQRNATVGQFEAIELNLFTNKGYNQKCKPCKLRNSWFSAKTIKKKMSIRAQ